MAARFLSLEEAAAKLGVTPDQLKELRDAGEIHGYRDGASWKFKPEEVDRVAAERGDGGASDDLGLDDLLAIDDSDDLDLGDFEELDDSSILVTEDAPQAEHESSSTIIGREGEDDDVVAEAGSESDLKLAPSDGGSSESGSSESEEFELSLDDSSSGSSGDSVELVDSGEIAADIGATIDASASGSDSDDFALSDDDLLLEGDDKLAAAAKDLALSDDDDLLLGAGSGSGSDDEFELSSGESGISLAASDLDAVVLDESSSSSGSDDFDLELSDDSMVVPAHASADEPESLKPDEEFLLTPAEDLMSDESSDSGSQVIALDDSESGSADLSPVLVPAGASESGEGVVPEMQPFQPAAEGMAYPTEALPEAQYSIVMMIWLSILTVTLMALGMVMFDIVRNMWSWQGQFASTSWLTDALVSALQLD